MWILQYDVTGLFGSFDWNEEEKYDMDKDSTCMLDNNSMAGVYEGPLLVKKPAYDPQYMTPPSNPETAYPPMEFYVNMHPNPAPMMYQPPMMHNPTPSPVMYSPFGYDNVDVSGRDEYKSDYNTSQQQYFSANPWTSYDWNSPSPTTHHNPSPYPASPMMPPTEQQTFPPPMNLNPFELPNSTNSLPTVTEVTPTSEVTTTGRKRKRKAAEVPVNLLKPNKKTHDRRVSPFPRILKRDIRRDYASMLCNVLNSVDEDFMGKYFNHFCRSSCKLYDFFPEALAQGMPAIRLVSGVRSIVRHLYREMNLVPDFVCHLQSAEIRQRLDTAGSCVVLNVQFVGTQIFSGDGLQSQMSALIEKFTGVNGGAEAFAQLAATFGGAMSGNTSLANGVSGDMDMGNLMAMAASAFAGGQNGSGSSVVSELSGGESPQSSNGYESDGSLESAVSGRVTVDPDLRKSLYNGLAQPVESITAAPWDIRKMDQYIDSQVVQRLTRNEDAAPTIGFVNDNITQIHGMANSQLTNLLPLLNKPMKLGVEGTIRMHLDSSHRIHRFEFVSSSAFKEVASSG